MGPIHKSGPIYEMRNHKRTFVLENRLSEQLPFYLNNKRKTITVRILKEPSHFLVKI